MQPSTWNDTNQHWIPQFLLKGFGIKGKATHVYALDKQTNAVTEHKVSEVASKPHLLTQRDDGELRKIEGAAARAMGMVRKKKGTDIESMLYGEATEGFNALHNLVKAMEPINPYIGVNAQGARTTFVDAFVATVKETAEQNGEIIDEQDFRRYIDRCLNHDVLSVSVSYPPLVEIPHIHIAPDGEYFVIGDSPVIAIRSADGLPLQRILPVSSKRVVTFAYNPARGQARVLGETNTLTISSTLSRDEVRSLNAHYFHRTRSRYIYGRNESILKQSALQPREWVTDESASPDYYWGLMLKLVASQEPEPYANADIVEIMKKIPISDFMRRARHIGRTTAN